LQKFLSITAKPRIEAGSRLQMVTNQVPDTSRGKSCLAYHGSASFICSSLWKRLKNINKTSFIHNMY